MSQLFDALRRAGRASHDHPPAGFARPRGDVVLRALGGAPPPRLRFLPYAGLLVLALLAGLAMWAALRQAPDSDAAAGPSGQESAPAEAPRPAPPDPVRSPDHREVPTASVTSDPRTESDEVPSAAGTPDRPRGASEPRSAGKLASVSRRAGDGGYEEFERAAGLQRAGSDEAALRTYRKLLERHQLAAEVHNNLGLLLQGRGQLAEAQQHFERAVAARPGYAAAHNNLGVLLLSMGQPDRAEASFWRAAGLDPRDPAALVNLALAQKARGRPERARESLLHALSLAPRSAPAHYNLAVLAELAGERGRAVEHYQAFLEYTGNEHRAYAALAQTRLEALQRMQ